MGRTIFFVTWDGAGNIPPEMAACQALSDAGHQVHVLTHDVLRDRVEASGAAFLPIRRAGQLDSTNPDEAVGEMLDRALLSHALLDEVKGTMVELDPDLVIADSMLLPALSLFAQSSVPSVAFHHTLGRFLFGGFFDQLSHSMKPRVDELLGASGLDTYERPVHAILSNDLILSATFEAFDRHDTGLPSNLVHVGPLRTLPPFAAPSAVERQHPDRPWVIVSLSTSFMDQRALLQRLADALAALPVEALLTTGPAIESSALDLEPNVAAVPFVSHDETLPRADLLITHAGHGTVAAGASLGVPMLCVPMGRDQPMVAARANELGLAHVCAADADHSTLVGAIQAALADDTLRASAHSFAEEARAHPGASEVVAQCEILMS